MRALKSLLLVPSTTSLVALVTVAGLAACSSGEDGSTNQSALDDSIDVSGRLDSGTTLRDGGAADAAHDASTDAGHTDAGDAASDAGSGTWTVEALPVKDVLYSVGGTGPNDVYVGGQAGIFHSTGNGTWTKEFQPNGVTLSMSTDGSGHMYASNLFAELATRESNGTWSESMTALCGNAGTRGSDILVIGSTLFGAVAGELCVSTVTDPGAVDPYTALGSAASLAGTTQAFVVGATESSTGFVGYYDTSWHTLASTGAVPPLYSIVAVGTSAIAFGTSAVYGSTANGPLTLLGSAGAADGDFSAAWGASVDDTWVISGGTPGVTHVTVDADGAAFEREPLPTAAGTLTAIWGTGTGEIYIVGANGTILHKK